MYETRHQAALHQDENNRAEAKAVGVAKGGAGTGKAAAGRTNNNRRALGDIGNVVGVCKDGLAKGNKKAEKKTLPVERPVTRSLAAHNPTAEEPSIQLTKEGEKAATNVEDVKTKPRRVLKKREESNGVERPAESSNDGDSKVSTDMPPGHPARMKALLNGKNGKLGVKHRKRRTLTATLTARSEAACGGFKQEEDEEEEEVPNIDAADVDDQLAVVDYVEDIYSFYRKTEAQSCVSPDYMSHQAHITDKMRAILVDWLIEVHLKCQLMPETLFLTSNLMDRYLAIQSVERKSLQLVGMTAMLIAAKYEEIWAPEIQDFVFISDNAYSREQILDMEKRMLNTLKFNLCVPTPYVFMMRFLKAASSDNQMNMLTFYLVELCLVDYAMVKFPPSMLAASAVYTAQCTLKGAEACWNATLRRHSGYTEAQLIECASNMVTLHQNASEGNLKVVQRKYSHENYSSVALLSPKLPTPTETNSNSNEN